MSDNETKRNNRNLTLRLMLMVAGMFAFGFALVPLYDVFCEITGIGLKSDLRAAAVTEAPDLNRTIRLEFVTSVNEYAPWEFRPAVSSMEVHPGKLYDATFFARNLSDKGLTGQAIANIAPLQATRYFQKTECFCFTPREFAPREGRELAVRFILDPELPSYVDTVTLSYTFFRLPEMAATTNN